MAKTFAEAAIDTRLIVSALQKMNIGDVLTYERMSADLSRPMRGEDGYLQSALRIASRDFDMVFSVVRGVGYKRLSDSEIVALGDEMPRRIRRHAQRTVRKLARARDEHLTPAERVQRNAAISMAGVLAHVATEKTMRKLESAVQAADSAQLPVGRVLELFKS